MNPSILKQPSGFMPLVMSLAAFALVLGHAAMFGIGHQADEGTAAHLYQLLVIVQVPIVAWFAITWLPRSPREAVMVLTLQAGAVAVAFAALNLLEHAAAR